MIILGFDPGLATLGYGVVKSERGKNEMIDYGVVLTPKEENLPVRLAMLEEGIKKVIQTFKPDEIAVEELFFCKNVTTAINVAHARGVLVKVIFETCELSEDCIRQGVDVCVDVGADFVKTSTGFAAKGATPEAVMTMVSQAAGRVRVKASGGIRTLEDARAYVEMGAERLGVGFSPVPRLTAAEGQNN